MTTRESLHRLIDVIPGDSLDAVERAIEPFIDPVARAPANAPIDDEEETDEERAAVAEALADIEAGRVMTLEELRRELGI